MSSASQLRREITERNLQRAWAYAHELSHYERSVVYAEDERGHGNFFPPSWKRIRANAAWSERLKKAYTSSALMQRRHDRSRGELECATSSDALLMNIFCAPSTLASSALRALLGIDVDATPCFGWRSSAPIANDHADRTSIDMRLGDLLVEAKLCETNFETSPIKRMKRYLGFDEVFDLQLLAPHRNTVSNYQLLRGVMAAVEHDARFCLMCDARRPDLISQWFTVMAAVRSSEVRTRLQLVTWQEIATHLATPLQRFLLEKYGITTA